MLAAVVEGVPAQVDERQFSLASFDTAWRIVAETHFDPTFNGLDWNAVRAELRPRAERAADADEVRLLIRDMLGRLGQSHFALLGPGDAEDYPHGPAGVPIEVRIDDGGRVLVTRAADQADASVKAGDELVAIDGQQVGALLDTIEADHPLRHAMQWRLVTSRLSGAVGSHVLLQLRSPDGTTRSWTATRSMVPGQTVSIGNLPLLRASVSDYLARTAGGRAVGVIRFNLWVPAVADPIADAVDRYRDSAGLVLDLRGNPGGLADMMRGIAGHLVDEPVTLGRMRMREITLEFRANPRRSTRDGRSVLPYSGPVAILVDELTASTSECFAGGLQALGRVRVFGVTTAGQALPAATHRLPNGDVLLYAIGDFVTGDQRRLEGQGVVPDTIVPLSAESLAAGRDAERAALDWFDTLKP
jgi:carboxyl-terminal processing protease